ncbi:MAG: helix-turn-helix domain-containing protein [Ktedonobacteraceae bacterium]
MSFGTAVEDIRVRRRVDRKMLAKHMGIDPSYLEEIEKDEVKPEVEFIRRLSDVLHLELSAEEWLLRELQHWKKREGERVAQTQLRCDACHRPISKGRAVLAFRQSRLDSYEYKKALVGSGGGQAVLLGTTCARNRGIVYTDDDW